MARRRGSLEPERALSISLHGTALRLVDQRVPTIGAVAHLRNLAGDRICLLAKKAGGMIGSYLAHPLVSPFALPAAHLLILAGADQDHAALVAAADGTRSGVGRAAYKL